MKILAFPLREVKSIISIKAENLPRSLEKIMMMYVLIGLSLALVGVAGLQFFYLVYLERIDRERRLRIGELERHCKHLTIRLREAEQQISEQAELINAAVWIESEEDEEVWADVIEDR